LAAIPISYPNLLFHPIDIKFVVNPKGLIRNIDRLDNPICVNRRSTPIAQQPQRNTDKQKTSKKANGSGVGVVADVSTLGVGGAIVARLSPDLNARVGVHGFGTGLDVDRTEVTYEGDLNLFNVSTILDYHVGGSGFRFSVGAVFSDNKAEGIGRPFAGGIEIGNQTFTTDELGSVDADISFGSDVSPYVGLGWGNPAVGTDGLGFWFNAGVIFPGSSEVSLNPNFGVAAQNSEVVRNEVNQALERERSDLEDRIDDFPVYPVVSLGFTYRF
jgi:hypothetical protein